MDQICIQLKYHISHMYQPISFVTLIHNGKNYRINKKLLISNSNLSRSLLSKSFHSTIRFDDNIPDNIFTDLLNEIQGIQIQYNNPIQLLQAAIIWGCPKISESIQNFLVANKNDCDTVISVLQLSLKHNYFLLIIENYVASQFQKFISFEQFSQVDPFIIFRIITWHQIVSVNPTILFNFFRSVHQNYPGTASILFNLIDLTAIPFDDLCSLLHTDGFDATVVSDQLQLVLENEQQKLDDFRNHHINTQNKIIMRLRKEKARLMTLCEKAETNYKDAVVRLDRAERALREQHTPIIDFDLPIAESELRRLQYEKEKSIKKLKKLQEESEKVATEMFNQATELYNQS